VPAKDFIPAGSVIGTVGHLSPQWVCSTHKQVTFTIQSDMARNRSNAIHSHGYYDLSDFSYITNNDFSISTHA
jgi:hypothetical protein